MSDYVISSKSLMLTSWRKNLNIWNDSKFEYTNVNSEMNFRDSIITRITNTANLGMMLRFLIIYNILLFGLTFLDLIFFLIILGVLRQCFQVFYTRCNTGFLPFNLSEPIPYFYLTWKLLRTLIKSTNSGGVCPYHSRYFTTVSSIYSLLRRRYNNLF
jgi:hypothetical protein